MRYTTGAPSDGGTSWGEDTRLTNNPAFSITPTVAAWGNNVQVVWVDLPGRTR